MASPLYFFDESELTPIFIIDFRGLRGDALIAAFREVASFVETQPPDSLVSMTLAKDIEYSASAMKAALDLAKTDRPFVRKSAIVGLDHLTGLVNVINRLTGRSLRAFHDEDVARSWLLKN